MQNIYRTLHVYVGMLKYFSPSAYRRSHADSHTVHIDKVFTTEPHTILMPLYCVLTHIGRDYRVSVLTDYLTD